MTPTAQGAAITDAPVVIVGGGLAGATVATTLREEGFTGPVVLLAGEPNRPYERPPLSKGYLLGTDERESAFVHPLTWYAENDVHLRLGTRVTAIDRPVQEVVLGDGSRLRYRDLVLATGAVPRTLEVPGADLAGVHYLHGLEDADALLAAFARKPRVVVVGGGWIGLETAAAARAAGLEVTVLVRGAAPLVAVLGPEMAGMFADLHVEHGVHLRTHAAVDALLSADQTTVSGVRLTDGQVVPADLVVVGIGAVPEVRLATDAGLEVATGDVAEAWRPALGRRLRTEHWANAQRQGAVAARSIMGADASDDRLPYFYTDQYDLGMEYVGYVGPDGYDELVVRGDLAKRELIAFWLREGRVVAGMNVNVWDVTEQIEELIRSGGRVDDRSWPVG